MSMPTASLLSDVGLMIAKLFCVISILLLCTTTFYLVSFANVVASNTHKTEVEMFSQLHTVVTVLQLPKVKTLVS